MNAESVLSRARSILPQFGIDVADVGPLGAGLINETFLVDSRDGLSYVFQRVNAIFPPAVNADIDAVTRHLDTAGYPTPMIVPTTAGQLYTESDGEIWRLLTYIPGVCVDAITTPKQAREAGGLLGRFHEALCSLKHQFANVRPGVHDTPHHLQALRDALRDQQAHRCYAEIKGLADQILTAAEQLPALPQLPDRIVHGDPKISNIVFDADDDRAICMIDLDTLTHMPLPLELGDAFRSWCNPLGEDTPQAEFSLPLFEAGVSGYAERTKNFISPAEWQSFVLATRIILLELAARFCTDALNEQYFGWDPKRFPGRSEHNQVRALAQLAEYRSLTSQADAAETIVRQAFAGS